VTPSLEARKQMTAQLGQQQLGQPGTTLGVKAKVEAKSQSRPHLSQPRHCKQEILCCIPVLCGNNASRGGRCTAVREHSRRHAPACSTIPPWTLLMTTAHTFLPARTMEALRRATNRQNHVAVSGSLVQDSEGRLPALSRPWLLLTQYSMTGFG